MTRFFPQFVAMSLSETKTMSEDGDTVSLEQSTLFRIDVFLHGIIMP